MANQNPGTALAKRVEMPAAPIAKIDELRNTYDRLAANVNLITPVQSPDYIPAMHSVSLRAVVIDANESRGDVYKGSFCGNNERAMTKIAILKLLQAAGGTVVESRRIDDRRDHYVAEFRVVIEIPQMDGTVRRFEATKGVDYRDGSPQVSAFSAAQLKSARQFVPDLAETKALLRAVRGALALKQKYTVDELARPFVVPALVPNVDMSDPEIKRMVAAKALGVSGQLYGPPPTEAAPVTHQIGDGRERPEPGQVIETTVLKDEPEIDLGQHNQTGPADSAEDFGMPPAPTQEPVAILVCECPHGCQAGLTEEVDRMTRERFKAPRCGKCVPWSPKFEQGKHRDLDDLGIVPKVSGAQAIAANIEWMKRQGGGR
jgi:hypothetical protein